MSFLALNGESAYPVTLGTEWRQTETSIGVLAPVSETSRLVTCVPRRRKHCHCASRSLSDDILSDGKK